MTPEARAKADAKRPECDCAETYLCRAIVNIDRHLGEGYAAKHPDLVGWFMLTSALCWNTVAIEVGIDRLMEQLEAVVEAMAYEDD